MSATPYRALPAHCFWDQAVAGVGPLELDPLVSVPFTIGSADAVATAGSCFAQHVARHLRGAGFRFLDTEPTHPYVTREEALAYNYGVFTARYGNVYTARQLLQLFQRAYGTFVPKEGIWYDGDRCIDPFRPRIQPGGFATREEFDADRTRHFAAVRRAFETLDVLVFTLGLTEYWEAAGDGAVFPLCPGVAGGAFDRERHVLRNAGVAEVVTDLDAFLTALRQVNPGARLVLSVSPVPLVATAMPNQHVLAANTYSKAVLRVACQEIAARHAGVAYMPAFEIITSAHSRGRYFGADMRSVNEAGVAHVMRVFQQHFTAGPTPPGMSRPPDPHLASMQTLATVNCDEEAIAGAADGRCNVCGEREFGPGPNGRLSTNGQLPHCRRCGSLERRRAIHAVLDVLPRPRRCLAAGDGIDAARFGAAVDLLPAEPERALAGLAAAGQASDCIVLTYFFEFQPDDQAAFVFAVDALAPDGILLVCCIDPHERASTVAVDPGKAGVWRLYGRDALEHFDCRARGLTALQLTATDPATDTLQVLYAIFKDADHSSISVLRKRLGTRCTGQA